MKSTVFVRPNLKMFVLGGILLVVVQHLITNGHSQGRGLSKPLPVSAREIADDDLQTLIAYAAEQPSAEIFMRISRCYESRGDYRQALRYLRRAEKVGFSDSVE